MVFECRDVRQSHSRPLHIERDASKEAKREPGDDSEMAKVTCTCDDDGGPCGGAAWRQAVI